VKPFDNNGNELNATFSATGAHPTLEITFESGDGRGRNSQYTAGVEFVLGRLSDLDATLRRRESQATL
jgi:hypothetical protein